MSRSIDEALTELEREAHIRIKCFDRWVEQGKLSWTDAHNRLEALLSAVKLLRDVQTAQTVQRIQETRLNQSSEPGQAEHWALAAHQAVNDAMPDNVVHLTQPEVSNGDTTQRKIGA